MAKNNIKNMQMQGSSDSLRKSIQNNLYKIMLISIVASVDIFSINQQGFFFGIN